MTLQAEESRMRRMADRQGLKLTKLRGADSPYILTTTDTNVLEYPMMFGHTRNGADLDEIRDYLAQ